MGCIQDFKKTFSKNHSTLAIVTEKIERFCRQPIDEGGIYELDEFQGVKFGTIWSWYYDFGTQEFYVSDGNPKNNPYHRVSF